MRSGCRSFDRDLNPGNFSEIFFGNFNFEKKEGKNVTIVDFARNFTKLVDALVCQSN